MESFYKTLKRELVNTAGFKTKDQAHQALVSYIELYYKSIRKHSSLGYITPREYEELNS
jgi:putative transposase